MKGMNKVILVGALGKDLEVKYTAKGKAFCALSLATPESWKDKSGQKHERTEWHRVVVWGKLAEIAGEYLRKGSQACIEGRLQTRKYQDKQGNDKYTTEIVADNLILLGNKGAEAKPTKPATSQPALQEHDFDDDIPF